MPTIAPAGHSTLPSHSEMSSSHSCLGVLSPTVAAHRPVCKQSLLLCRQPSLRSVDVQCIPRYPWTPHQQERALTARMPPATQHILIWSTGKSKDNRITNSEFAMARMPALSLKPAFCWQGIRCASQGALQRLRSAVSAVAAHFVDLILGKAHRTSPMDSQGNVAGVREARVD